MTFKKSPFPKPYWNAVLTFKLHGMVTGVDSQTGNPIVEDIEIVYDALLETTKTSSLTLSPTGATVTNHPGINQQGVLMEGWLTFCRTPGHLLAPHFWDWALYPQMPDEAIAQLARGRSTEAGIFKFDGLVEEPWKIEDYTGTRIKGIWKRIQTYTLA